MESAAKRTIASTWLIAMVKMKIWDHVVVGDKSLKLLIEWLHQTRGKYRLVTSQRGGGTQIYRFNRGWSTNSWNSHQLCQEIPFPGGLSDISELADMEIKLFSYTGELIQNTGTKKDVVCKIKKNIGVSKCVLITVLLRTSEKGPE